VKVAGACFAALIAFQGHAASRVASTPNASSTAQLFQVHDNDSSCDIGTAPAATLLLPLFEVETYDRALDTLFTVINVGERRQIAKVTLWTDWSYPVFTFNVVLTGYGTRSFSVYDILVNREVTSTSESVLAAVREALISGKRTQCASAVGSPSSAKHSPAMAVGYITIDVTSVESATMPNDPAYFHDEILFDNVLTGDYETVDRSEGSNFSSGGPLVHVRATPEGGPAGVPLATKQTNLPRTFYSAFVSDNYDRRQPLPASFAARYIQSETMRTDLKLWHEPLPGAITCTTVTKNAQVTAAEIVRFDEHENPNTFTTGWTIATWPTVTTLQPLGRVSTSGPVSPPMNSPAGDLAGWIYLNLDSRRQAGWRASQAWVIVMMRGAGSDAGAFGVEYDAVSRRNTTR